LGKTDKGYYDLIHLIAIMSCYDLFYEVCGLYNDRGSLLCPQIYVHSMRRLLGSCSSNNYNAKADKGNWYSLIAFLFHVIYPHLQKCLPPHLSEPGHSLKSAFTYHGADRTQCHHPLMLSWKLYLWPLCFQPLLRHISCPWWLLSKLRRIASRSYPSNCL